MKKLSSIMVQRLGEQSDLGLQAEMIVQICNRKLKEILDGSEKCVIKKFDNGKLTVYCASAGWSNELRMREKELVQRFNEELERDLILGLRFRLVS